MPADFQFHENSGQSLPTDDILVSVKGVSKKFCRNLKRSMVYGVSDISKSFVGIRPDTNALRKQEFWAVDDVSFELKRGETLGLIGANGSGKSTLLRLLTGIFPPDRGEIKTKGRVGALIALGAGFHPHMTGLENIYLNGIILGMSSDEIKHKLNNIIEFADIGDFVNSPVSTYSSGMRVRLGFAIAAHIEPDILLIDEVLAVGDIGFRTKCLNAIEKISRNAAVIFVSHIMPQVTRICSDIIVMEHGRVGFQGKDSVRGVEHYFSSLSGTKSYIAGSGNATISDIQLSSEETTLDTQQGLFTIQRNNSLTIELSFSIAPLHKNPIVSIVFFTIDELPVAQCDSDSNNFEFNLGNENSITGRVTIPNIPFNHGRYLITLVIWDDRRQEIMAHHHAIKQFQVVDTFMGVTPVHLKGEWQPTREE